MKTDVARARCGGAQSNRAHFSTAELFVLCRQNEVDAGESRLYVARSGTAFARLAKIEGTTMPQTRERQGRREVCVGLPAVILRPGIDQ
jgi:hypothetical protein